MAPDTASKADRLHFAGFTAGPSPAALRSIPVSVTHLRHVLAGVVLLSVQVVGLSCKAQQKPAIQTHRVAMRDGVKLATDVYVPENGGPRFPTILLRTPYNKSGNAAIAATAARFGYARDVLLFT
jgi:predicted acyl esterase